MPARKVSKNASTRIEAMTLRSELNARTRVTASDPLKLRKEQLDRELRQLRSATSNSLVEVIE